MSEEINFWGPQNQNKNNKKKKEILNKFSSNSSVGWNFMGGSKTFKSNPGIFNINQKMQPKFSFMSPQNKFGSMVNPNSPFVVKPVDIFRPAPYLGNMDRDSPFRLPINRIKQKDIRWTQMQGNPKYRKVNMDPFGDADHDGVLNMFDCRPFDFSRQEDLKKDGSKKKSILQPVDDNQDYMRDIYGRTPKERRELTEKKLALRERSLESKKISAAAKLAETARKAQKQQESDARAKEKLEIARKVAETKELKAQGIIAAKNRDTERKVKFSEAIAGARQMVAKARSAKFEGQVAIGKGKIAAKAEKYKSEAERYRENQKRLELKLLKQQAKSGGSKTRLGTLGSFQLTEKIIKAKQESYSGQSKNAKDKLEEVKASFDKRVKGYDQKLNEAKSDKEKQKIMKEYNKLKSEEKRREAQLKTEEKFYSEKARAAESRAVKVGDIVERKRKQEMFLESMGIGTAKRIGSVAAGKIKGAFKRRDASIEKKGRAISQRVLAGVGVLTDLGGLSAIQDRGAAMDAAERRKAGRPFGTFKHGMPIEEYRKMVRGMQRNARIEAAMQEAAKAAALEQQTSAAIQGGITYTSQAIPGQLSSIAVQPSAQIQMGNQYTQQAILNQQSSAAASPIAGPIGFTQAPGPGVPVYGQPVQVSTYGNYGSTNKTPEEIYNIMKQNKREREFIQLDYPLRPGAGRSMPISAIRSNPMAYGTINADPRYARIPSLPTDPALIYDDQPGREYYADEDQASQAEASSEGTYQKDITKGDSNSLSGKPQIIYAARKKNVIAPMAKNMIVQTQNDGMRKMAPTLKANPWGLQLKNRINFGENNILEADLQGNVASRDQIGGNILNAENVFQGDNRAAGDRMGRSISSTGSLGSSGYNTGTVGSSVPNPEVQMSWLSPTNLNPEIAAQQLMMQQEQIAQMESRQPSFFQRLASGQPILRKNQASLDQSQPIEISQPNKRPSIFDRMKVLVSGSSPPTVQRQQMQQQVQQQDYSNMAQEDEQDISINMTEEEFNALSPEEQDMIIQQSQTQQDTSPESDSGIDNYQTIRDKAGKYAGTHNVSNNPDQNTQYNTDGTVAVGSGFVGSSPRGISMGQGGTPY